MAKGIGDQKWQVGDFGIYNGRPNTNLFSVDSNKELYQVWKVEPWGDNNAFLHVVRVSDGETDSFADGFTLNIGPCTDLEKILYGV